MNRYALALRLQDQAMVQQSLNAIRRFNQHHPTVVLPSPQRDYAAHCVRWPAILGSLSHGMLLSKDLQGLKNEVRFALPRQ